MNEFSIPLKASRLQAAMHIPKQPLDNSVLLMCHGFRGSKDGGGRAVKLAELAVTLGLTVVRFDFTPCCLFSQQISEIAQVVQYVRKQIGSRIYLLGRSMGGSAALVYGAKDPNLAGLIFWATPCNLEETFRLALGRDYGKLMKGQAICLEDDYGSLSLQPRFVKEFQDYDLLQCAKNLPAIPKLIVHGSADEIVPLVQSQHLYQMLSQPKEFMVIPNGDHQFSAHAEMAAQTVVNWLSSVI